MDSGTALFIGLALIGATSLATIGRAMDEIPKIEASVNASTAVAAPVVPTVPTTPVTAAVPSSTPAAAPTADATTPDDQPVSLQECQNIRQQIRDQLREAKRIEKLLRKMKLASDLDTMTTLRGRLEGYQGKFVVACTRDIVQEFYDDQIGDEVQALRCKAEIPQQITQIERDLKRLEKRATAKVIAQTGLNPEKLQTNIAAMRTAITEARTAVGAGNCDDANEALQPIYQGMHPGEVMGVLDRLRELTTNVKRVRDDQVRAQIQDLIQPIIDSANDGDFREANQALNDIFNELQRVLFQLAHSRRFQGDFGKKLDQLDRMIQAKLDAGGQAVPAPVPAP